MSDLDDDEIKATRKMNGVDIPFEIKLLNIELIYDENYEMQIIVKTGNILKNKAFKDLKEEIYNLKEKTVDFMKNLLEN